jgi:hypothetical protein
MSKYRIGPYIEQLRHTDDIGRFRSTHRDFPDGLITDSLVGLHSLLDNRHRARLSWNSYYDRLPGLAAEIDEIVRADCRPVDRILDDRLAHTDYDYWKEHHATWLPPYPHRILIDTQITKTGNLSVRFSPQCLGPSGQWEHAPEWRQLPDLGTTEEVMKRPNDEVLFVRNAEWLFEDSLARRNLYHGEVDRAEQALFSTAGRAVNMAFWLVIHRLSSRFEVHLGRYVALLSSTQDAADCLGLDIVDALQEHRASIQEAVARFEEDTGHTPRQFCDVCEQFSPGRRYVQASKLLRRHAGASSKLTPSAVEGFHNKLRIAERYGLWAPGAAGETPGLTESEPGGQLVPPAVAPTSQTIAYRPRPAPQAAAPMSPRRRRPDEPPDYSRLARYAATREELASAGVSSVEELVSRVNAHVASGNLTFPVSHFDFPNTKKKFAKLAGLLSKLDGSDRTIRARYA